MKDKILYSLFFVSSALLLNTLDARGAELVVDTTLRKTQVEVQSAKDLPKEQINLPSSLDKDLERLLHSWYDGYGKRSTANAPKPERNRSYESVPDSVYIQMLERMPSAMRLSYNPIVRECIELYTNKRRSLLSLMLSLADLYFPEIETALDQHKLPLELKYLTIVESSLNPAAFSPMGAAGLWQLMLPTARIYGLRINSLVDERLDPNKSTSAACKLLKELHHIYKDWWLVLAAYNCGPGNVNKAIRRSGKDKPSFWDIYAYLPRETRRYVPLFIGAYFSMYYHDTYEIEPRELGRPIATDHYLVERELSFKRISELTEVPIELIRLYNPQFRRDIIPGNTEPYQLRLPIASVMKLEDVTDEEWGRGTLAVETTEPVGDVRKEASRQSGKSTRTHKVRRGETIASIAKRYGVSASQIRKWNKLKGSKLKAGQKLIVSK